MSFLLKEEHIKLLESGYFRYDGYCEFGSVGLDCKRPFGNSDVYDDIAEILGDDVYDIDPETGERELMGGVYAVYDKLYQELGEAMTIIFQLKIFEPGEYELVDWHKWKKVKEK